MNSTDATPSSPTNPTGADFAAFLRQKEAYEGAAFRIIRIYAEEGALPGYSATYRGVFCFENFEEDARYAGFEQKDHHILLVASTWVGDSQETVRIQVPYAWLDTPGDDNAIRATARQVAHDRLVKMEEDRQRHLKKAREEEIRLLQELHKKHPDVLAAG